jgi:hypothetical protein
MLAAQRVRRIGWCAALLALVASWSAMGVTLPARSVDDSNPREMARQRFDLTLHAAKAASEPLPRFLERWLATATAQDIELLDDAPQGWIQGGREPHLYRVFVSDSAIASRLDEVLPALETLLQRAPALAAQAPWQSLLARARLKAGQLPLALASARRGVGTGRAAVRQRLRPARAHLAACRRSATRSAVAAIAHRSGLQPRPHRVHVAPAIE